MLNYEYDEAAERRVLFKEGKEEGISKVAVNMIKDKVPIQTIVKYTGLSIDTLKELEKELIKSNK